jgi:hypothetical protein
LPPIVELCDQYIQQINNLIFQNFKFVTSLSTHQINGENFKNKIILTFEKKYEKIERKIDSRK